MAKPGRTQKQIAERYKGNLGYYRSLHPWRRARLIVSLLTIIGGLVAIVSFQRCGRENFFNAGRISSSHATIAQKCDACHDKGVAFTTGLKSTISDRFHQGVSFAAIDRKCESCHKQHTFHEPNVVQDRSCSACHQEHRGITALRVVASSQCATCHNQPQVMTAAAQKGMDLHVTAQDRHPQPSQQNILNLPRPPQGFTQTFDSFAGQHPEFQLHRVNAKDPDVLRFNHQRHFAADIPPVNGQKLDCAFCHKPLPDGRFYQRISFNTNCLPCHSLQFDWRNPDLHIPHGNVELVRTFLRTLPAQYADHARITRGIPEREIPTFVAQQVKQLRDQFHSGDELERAVFFTTNPYKPQEKADARTRANFTGCAFCHDVKQTAATVSITRPKLIDRWMLRSDFNHTKHASVKCEVCHRAAQSRDTADVLMPVKANCVTCHSPQGKVASECITCHKYHAPANAQTEIADVSAVKEMLLGRR